MSNFTGPGDEATTAGRAEAITERARRHRDMPRGGELIADTIGQKVLHGWLQNRQQILVPLSVNLARATPEERRDASLFAALAADAAGDEISTERLRDWLLGAGAGEADLAAFDRARATPPGIGQALAPFSVPERAGLAYVIALIAAQSDARRPGPNDTARLFADYVARRLSLPTQILRSAERRYRG